MRKQHRLRRISCRAAHSHGNLLRRWTRAVCSTQHRTLCNGHAGRGRTYLRGPGPSATAGTTSVHSHLLLDPGYRCRI